MEVICNACGSDRTQLAETVSTQKLARAWAAVGCHGETSNFESVRSYIDSALGCEEVEFWKCANCGLEIARPMLSWPPEHYPEESPELGFDHQQALYELRKLPPSRILELGCADGKFLQQVAAIGHEVVGFDFSDSKVEAASAKGLEVTVTNVSNIAHKYVGKQKFDVIAMFQIIEHLNDPDEVFSQLSEIVAPDCLLLIGCPSHLRYTRVFDHPDRIALSDFWDYPPQHTLRWTPKALEIFLSRHHWRAERVDYEPITLSGSAAHLTCLHGLGSGWYTNAWRRRVETLKWIFKIAWATPRMQITGIRVFVSARRELKTHFSQGLSHKSVSG